MFYGLISVSKGIPEGYVESIMKDTNASLETTQAKVLLVYYLMAYAHSILHKTVIFFFIRPSMLQTFFSYA